jgi:SSS family solute:Na+ symporter
VIAVISGLLFFNEDLVGISLSVFKEPFQQLFDPPLEQRYLSLFLLPFLYAFLAQDLGQRYFSTKNPWVASLSSFIAGVIVLGFSLVPVIIGIGAHERGLAANSGIEVFLGMFKNNTLPFFYYLLVCAIIAAISSTADGILCAVGSNVVEDFSLVANANPSERYVGVLISRIVILVVGLTSLFIGYAVDDILGVLSLSYELSVSCLLIPVLFALFFKKLPFLAAALAMAMGVLGILVFRFYPFILPKELFSLMLSLLGFLVGLIYHRVKNQPS